MEDQPKKDRVKIPFAQDEIQCMVNLLRKKKEIVEKELKLINETESLLRDGSSAYFANKLSWSIQNKEKEK